MQKKINGEYSTTLCAEGIDEISERIRGFLAELKIPKRDVLRYSMTAEEILFNSEKICGATSVRLKTGRRFRRYYITLEINGKQLNVFAAQDEERGVFGGGMLKNLGLSPEYAYVNDRNVYSFSIKHKQANPFVSLGVAAVLAVIVGSLGYLFSDATRDVLLNDVLIPLNDAFFDVLGCIAGPMIFLSVAWGIYGIGDAATLKKSAKSSASVISERSFLRYLLSAGFLLRCSI